MIPYHKKDSIDIWEKIDPRLLSMEFFFLIITGILAINLVSIFRPFPIGWDDL